METEIVSASAAQQQPDFATLSGRLMAISRTLESDPASASLQAGEVFTAIPGQPQALLLFAAAYRVMNELNGAQEILQLLADENPKLASIQYELGLVLARLGRRREAIACFTNVVEAEPNHPAAWRALGNQYSLEGDAAAAANAYSRQIFVSLRELRLLEEAVSDLEKDPAKPENMLIQALAVNPTDVSLLHLLAEVGMKQTKYKGPATLLERALKLAPHYHAARQSYAVVLNQEGHWREAIEQFDIILNADPDAAQVELLKAWSVVMMSEYKEAERLFDKLRPKLEDGAPFWLNYGHFLRTIARSGEAVEAYKRCLEIDPGVGLAWWSLANMKTYRFSPGEIDAMRAQLLRDDLEYEARSHLEFAVGAALEIEKSFAESFEHYYQGNVLRRAHTQYDPDEAEQRSIKIKEILTPEFLRAHAGSGSQAPDPIFIVGMPRAGSTLIEQILSSHSQVEGTAELPDMSEIVSELRDRSELGYPEILAALDYAEFKTLGEKYLETTRHQRKTDRPFFTDKAPQNFLSVGLIHLILPKARIIDARRHPMACCFSGYKQCFSIGSMPHSYELSEIGRYYRDYVEMMAYMDEVLPGRVHRVFHENMVRDSEVEIRRLLEYCGLPFEEQCLRFYESDRSVRTASSEQVRQPIYAKKTEPWTHYEPWLGPMKQALGEVLELYPVVPKFGR